MRNPLFTLLALAAVLSCGGAFTRADEPSSAEGRLRDALKNTMIQLRTATANNDNLTAQLADLQSQKDDLQKKLDALTKMSAADKDAENKKITVLQQQVSDQQDSITQLQTTLEKWQTAEKKAVQIANDTEAKRAKLADLSIHLQRYVDDQRRKNQEMYKTGMELLDRYEKFGLGEALFAKEPFIGITRTKFETLIQDYEDKLVDAQITEQKPPQTAKTNQ